MPLDGAYFRESKQEAKREQIAFETRTSARMELRLSAAHPAPGINIDKSF